MLADGDQLPPPDWGPALRDSAVGLTDADRELVRATIAGPLLEVDALGGGDHRLDHLAHAHGVLVAPEGLRVVAVARDLVLPHAGAGSDHQVVVGQRTLARLRLGHGHARRLGEDRHRRRDDAVPGVRGWRWRVMSHLEREIGGKDGPGADARAWMVTR